MRPAALLVVGALLGARAAEYEPIYSADGLIETQRAKCDGDGLPEQRKALYATKNYLICCGKGRFFYRKKVCRKAQPRQPDDERTPAWPKIKNPVPALCTACARLVDNFDRGLLPALHRRQKQIEKHHSRSRYARSATLGELEDIVETEVERICNWPRTHHEEDVRRVCNRLVEERSEEIVTAISGWARDGSYALSLGGELSTELRPALCVAELGVCSDEELEQLVAVDADESAKLEVGAKTGFVEDTPLESERPSAATEGVLLRVVAEDFHTRVVEQDDVDWLVYMYFPGRTQEVTDTHAKLRGKFVRLAQFLDAPGSNGSLAVGWMDCVFNQIPHPHGMHVKTDTIALYSARAKTRPNYYLNLREGDVEMHELAQFVWEASARVATKEHVERRHLEIGERGLREGFVPMDFVLSLGIDERQLKPENLTALRIAIEGPETVPPDRRLAPPKAEL